MFKIERERERGQINHGGYLAYDMCGFAIDNEFRKVLLCKPLIPKKVNTNLIKIYNNSSFN